MRPVAACLIVGLVAAPGGAQTRLTDADLPHVVRLAEAWAEGARRHRVEETDPAGFARAIDQALAVRRDVFTRIERGDLDPLAWLKSAAPRLAIPPEARYLPQCSRGMTRATAALVPASAAEGARFPLPSPTVVLTLGEGSVSEYAAAAAREDSATVKRLEREAITRSQAPRPDAPIGALLGASMAEAMGLVRAILEPTGPARAAVDSVTARWRRDRSLAVESSGASVTATPRDLSRDSVEMVVMVLPMWQPGAAEGGCEDLAPAAWMTMQLLTLGPFDGRAVIERAEAEIRATRGAQEPSFLGSALWDACKAAAPYGAKWIAQESEDASERARLTANGAWFARHRARLEPLLLAARTDPEDDACGMDREDIASLMR